MTPALLFALVDARMEDFAMTAVIRANDVGEGIRAGWWEKEAVRRYEILGAWRSLWPLGGGA